LTGDRTLERRGYLGHLLGYGKLSGGVTRITVPDLHMDHTWLCRTQDSFSFLAAGEIL
jgi:hypothetical protein